MHQAERSQKAISRIGGWTEEIWNEIKYQVNGNNDHREGWYPVT